jgi:ArsR family transcriptional regulator
MAKNQLPPELMARVADRFRLLGDPLRLNLLQILRGGEQGVGDLAEALGTSIPNVSKHLKQLAQAGVLARRQAGTSVYYSIADAGVFDLCEVVCGALERQAKAEVKLLLRR